MLNDIVLKMRTKYAGIEIASKEDAIAAAVEASIECLKHMDGFPVRLVPALKSLGFEIWAKTFKERSISGVMALNSHPEHKKVIGVNRKDGIGHQYFSLAHELAHYIFDVQDENEEYITVQYNTNVDNEKNLRELRANKFAANLLMPSDAFRERIEFAKKKFHNSSIRIEYMTMIFGVSQTAVKRRLEELNLVV